MKNRVGKYYGRPTDAIRAEAMIRFCDVMWELHLDPNALQDWEIETLSQLEDEAAKALRRARSVASGRPLPS
jgi:hypothetical protein